VSILVLRIRRGVNSFLPQIEILYYDNCDNTHRFEYVNNKMRVN